MAGRRRGAGGELRRLAALPDHLHIVSRHEVADNAEAMYRRAAVCADERDLAQLQTELSDLQHQLGLLAEMEQCNLRNIL